MLLAVSALLFAAAPGGAGQHHAEDPIATPAGDPVNCVRLNQILRATVRDGTTIDFVMRNGRVYRNRLDGGICPSLSSEKRFLYKTSSGDLCSYDTITVLRDAGPTRGATCGLGSFQPVTLAKR
jgi:hypothetical protein